VVPGATSSGDLASAGGQTSATCYWDNATHKLTLTLTLNTGVPEAQLEMSTKVEVDDYQGEFVDVGADNDADVWSVMPVSLTLNVVHSGVLVTLDIIGDGAPDQKAAITDLATSVIDRL